MPIYHRIAAQHSSRVLLGFGGVAAAASLAIGVLTAATRPLPAPDPVCLDVAPLALPATPVTRAQPVPPMTEAVHSSELQFVFTADKAAYMKLVDLRAADEDPARPLVLPRHGKLRHVEDDGVHASIAVVAARDVPADYAVWQGRKVKVDNTCEAHVVGFAIVSRLVGEPSYAGVDAWTANTVLAAGQPVLAARLDGCTGAYARDASLPDVVIPTVVHDAALEQAGKAALVDSQASRDTQRAWDEQTQAMGGAPSRWDAGDAVIAQVVRHPQTGETFVSVHGHVEGSCGGPEANLWGLFRVRAGQLETVQLRALGDIETIDALIDVDGDGELELLGKGWFGDNKILTRGNGDPIDQLRVPFHGCPC